MTSRQRTISSLLSAALPWVAGFLPALVMLWMILSMRVSLPWHDGWAFVQQYRDLVEGRYSWGQLFAPHYAHPSAVGKVIYFAVLHWMHGDVKVLPLFTWGFSLVIALSVCLLSRPLWTGNRLLGAALMFFANLTVFTAAQGHTWIWDFVFQNFIPGTCLASGMFLLSGGRPPGWGRITAAALLSVIAIFSFGTGFLVGALLSVLLWHGLGDMGASRKLVRVGAWLVFCAVTTWIAHKALVRPGDAFASADEPIGVSILWDRPLMRLQFVLILLGRMLGTGTVFSSETLCTVMGGAVLTVFLACIGLLVWHRRSRELVAASLPWIVCSLYGLGSAGLICAGRMRYSFSFAYYPRYITFTLFFALGTFFLVATLLRHGDVKAATIRGLRKAVGPLWTVFLVAHAVSWQEGWLLMNVYNMRFKQELAELDFADIIPLGPDALWNNRNGNTTFALAKFLSTQGGLRSVKYVSDNRMSAVHQGSMVSEKWARFDKPVLLDDGRCDLTGTCGVSKDDSLLPDLVLVTAESPGQEERIIAVTPPLLPEHFFAGYAIRREHPEHYFGWFKTLPPGLLPQGPVTLRAYVFDHDAKRARPIFGEQKLVVPAK